MTTVYTYHADDRVESVTNGNGSSTWYTYDPARRMTKTEHRDLQVEVFHRLEYTYDGRHLPLALTESDAVGWTATVTFTYDTRGRLTAEVRTGQNPYGLAYQYDLGGNRTRKVDALNDTEVVYHYDLEDPLVYESDNNRLEYYETFDTSGQDPVLVSTTWYYYNASGNVKQVVTNQAGMNDYSSTRLVYAGNGEVVSYVLGETWTWDGVSQCPASPTNYNITYAREFRYDGPRQRYLNRELDPAALMDGEVSALAENWSDYEGDEVYGDFRLDSGVPVELRSFDLGIAKADPWTATGGGTTDYYHADLIGTTRWMSNPSGIGESPATYTAFGERISGSMSGLGDRYNYAGAWGYQSNEEFPFLHVGARYYDPATGRFLQRDPIGIAGGLNVYAYAMNRPTADVDPTGEGVWRWVKVGGGAVAGIVGGILIAVTSPAWVTALGVGLVFTALVIALDEINNVWRTARRVVAPVCAPLKDYKRAVDQALDKIGYGEGGSMGGRGGGGSGGQCFVAGTPVQTTSGGVPIEQIRREDCVLGFDGDLHSSVEATVARVITGRSRSLIEITVGGEAIVCTGEHPFYVDGSGWTKARELREGDLLRSKEGTGRRIIAMRVRTLEQDEQVYTLHVSDCASF